MNKVKTFFIAFWTVLASWLGILAVPVLILVLCNVIDYVTGIVASVRRDEAVNSRRGLTGIIKKVCMWILIGIGAMVDWLILYAANTIGITLPVSFLIACLVAVWLIANEIISILENMLDIGVSIPPFLIPLVKTLRKQAEDKGNINGDDADA